MTKAKLIGLGLLPVLFGAWSHGLAPLAPSSNTALVQSGALYVVSSSGAYVATNDQTLAGATYKLVCQGDSLTAVSVQQPGYCVDVVGSLSSGRSITATWKPMGMVGYSWNYNFNDPWIAQTINTMAASQIDTEIYPGLTNVLVMWAGTNGMWSTFGNHSAATEYSDFQTAYAAHIAAGWTAANIIVVTTLPRQDDASFDAKRATYNADLISFCGSNGCKIADVGGDATIGCNGCEDNSTYYQSNKIHLTAAGQTIAASLIYAQVP